MRLFEGGWILPSGKFEMCNHAQNWHHDMITLVYFNPEIDKKDIMANPENYFDPNEERSTFYQALEAGWIRISSNEDGEETLVIDISGTRKITRAAYSTLVRIMPDFKDWDIELDTPERFYQPASLPELWRTIRTIYEID
jgi:hypothetical protein